MYRRNHPGQLEFPDFYLPFSGKLDEDWWSDERDAQADLRVASATADRDWSIAILAADKVKITADNNAQKTYRDVQSHAYHASETAWTQQDQAFYLAEINSSAAQSSGLPDPWSVRDDSLRSGRAQSDRDRLAGSLTQTSTAITGQRDIELAMNAAETTLRNNDVATQLTENTGMANAGLDLVTAVANSYRDSDAEGSLPSGVSIQTQLSGTLGIAGRIDPSMSATGWLAVTDQVIDRMEDWIGDTFSKNVEYDLELNTNIQSVAGLQTSGSGTASLEPLTGWTAASVSAWLDVISPDTADAFKVSGHISQTAVPSRDSVPEVENPFKKINESSSGSSVEREPWPGDSSSSSILIDATKDSKIDSDSIATTLVADHGEKIAQGKPVGNYFLFPWEEFPGNTGNPLDGLDAGEANFNIWLKTDPERARGFLERFQREWGDLVRIAAQEHQVPEALLWTTIFGELIGFKSNDYVELGASLGIGQYTEAVKNYYGVNERWTTIVSGTGMSFGNLTVNRLESLAELGQLHLPNYTLGANRTRLIRDIFDIAFIVQLQATEIAIANNGGGVLTLSLGGQRPVLPINDQFLAPSPNLTDVFQEPAIGPTFINNLPRLAVLLLHMNRYNELPYGGKKTAYSDGKFGFNGQQGSIIWKFFNKGIFEIKNGQLLINIEKMEKESSRTAPSPAAPTSSDTGFNLQLPTDRSLGKIIEAIIGRPVFPPF